MSSREKILAAVKEAQPEWLPLPEMPSLQNGKGDVQQFQALLESIGGKVVLADKEQPVGALIESLFPAAKRMVSADTSVERYLLQDAQTVIHHTLHDAEVVIIKAGLGVAENGAIWVTEAELKIRVLPFIGEHLVVLLDRKDIVPTMHEAYAALQDKDYSFGVFIAGPSKTADIEQSLVLGAHGPKTMTAVLL